MTLLDRLRRSGCVDFSEDVEPSDRGDVSDRNERGDREDPAERGEQGRPGDRGGPRDQGTIMLLTLGYLVVALMLVAVVVDVSAVFLARRSLASDCDAASLAAAQQVSQRPLYQGRDGARLVLDPGGSAAVPGETLEADVGAGGTTVVVRGRREVTLPLGHMLGLGTVTVTAASDAQSLSGP